MDLKYTTLFIIMIFMGIEAIMTAGSLISFKLLEFLPVFIITFLGMYISDLFWYLLGFTFGDKITLKFKKFIPSECFVKLKQFVLKRGFWVVFLSKFIFLGRFGFLASGLAKMKMKKFFFYLFIANIISISVFLGLGYYFSSLIKSIVGNFKIAGIIIFLFIVFFIIIERIISKYFKNKLSFKNNSEISDNN